VPAWWRFLCRPAADLGDTKRGPLEFTLAAHHLRRHRNDLAWGAKHFAACRLQVIIGTDAYTVFKDADWALLIGAKPRGPGMERSALLDINGQVRRTRLCCAVCAALCALRCVRCAVCAALCVLCCALMCF
jgi:hypothetical protein